MFTIKKMADGETWVYRKRKDDEPDDMTLHIIEDGMCNEYEMDYFSDVSELIHWVEISMDTFTEIIVVPAKEVLDSPIKDGYFFY